MPPILSNINTISGSPPNPTILLIGLGAIVIFLTLLLVLVSVIYGRRSALRKRGQAELDRFKEEVAAARGQAQKVPQPIIEMPQRPQMQSYNVSAPQAQLPINQTQPGRMNQPPNRPMPIQTPQRQNTSPVEESIQGQQAKEAVDSLAIQARLQRLWDQVDN